MAYFFKANKHDNFFDPVTRLHVMPGKPVKIEVWPSSSYFDTAMRNAWITKIEEAEYNEIMGIAPEVKEELGIATEVKEELGIAPEVKEELGIAPEVKEELGIAPEVKEEPTPGRTKKDELLELTKKEILIQFDWMDFDDLSEAKKKAKVDMVDFLLKIEKEYDD